MPLLSKFHTIPSLLILSVLTACYVTNPTQTMEQKHRNPVDASPLAGAPRQAPIKEIVTSQDQVITHDPKEIFETKSWCPAGIQPSETVTCPTLALTYEQHDAIEAAKNRRRATTSNVCPIGMRDVDGLYCETIEHKCTSCRAKTMPDGSVQPCYFCNHYVPGWSNCKGTQKPIHVCVDEYEYPNLPGEAPTIMVNWYDAHRLCAAQNKRLCTDEEWTLACEGPQHKPYSYGWDRDAAACNIDKHAKRDAASDQRLFQGGTVRAAELARLWDAVPIAASPRCVSDYGVYDMGGNVDEVTDNVSRGNHPYKDLWKGGHWVGGARNRCRPYTDGHNEGFGYYANGFRCCANPHTTPTH